MRFLSPHASSPLRSRAPRDPRGLAARGLFAAAQHGRRHHGPHDERRERHVLVVGGHDDAGRRRVHYRPAVGDHALRADEPLPRRLRRPGHVVRLRFPHPPRLGDRSRMPLRRRRALPDRGSRYVRRGDAAPVVADRARRVRRGVGRTLRTGRVRREHHERVGAAEHLRQAVRDRVRRRTRLHSTLRLLEAV